MPSGSVIGSNFGTTCTYQIFDSLLQNKKNWRYFAIPAVLRKVLPTEIHQSIYSKNMVDFLVCSRISSNLVAEVPKIIRVLESCLVVYPIIILL
jgi:hypothetical protein